MCVVCIGFIALLAAVGISRIKNAQRHSRDAGVDDKQEMEWDNSALTITVNPMDQEVRPGKLTCSFDKADDNFGTLTDFIRVTLKHPIT